MKKNKLMVITTLICLLPVIMSLIVYNRLPDRIPIHWGTDGEPNGYAGKFLAAFGLPVFMAVINIIAHLSLDYDPKKKNASSALIRFGKWCIPVLTLILMPVTLLWAMDYKISIQKLVPFLVGLLFIVFGNYLPKSKQSYTVGIKLPWTLNSTENWNKTHHLAGYLWIVSGLIMILGCFTALGILIPIVIGGMILIPCIYSFYLYTKGI